MAHDDDDPEYAADEEQEEEVNTARKEEEEAPVLNRDGLFGRFAKQTEDWRFGADYDGEKREYRFDKYGRLRNKDGGFYKYEKAEYETVADEMTKDQHEMMCEYFDLKKVQLNCSRENRNAEEDDDDDLESPFFMASNGFESADTILFIIHGTGAVRAGQWSRRLIINQGLAEGSQLGYVDLAHANNCHVILTDTNHLKSSVTGKPLKGNFDPVGHGTMVWKQMLMTCKRLERVIIIAHSYGGYVTENILRQYDPATGPLAAVCLLDSFIHVHKEIAWVVPGACHWVNSSSPLGKRLPDRGGIQAYSAGTTDHDAVPVKAISEVLKYMTCVLQQPADDSTQAENRSSIEEKDRDDDDRTMKSTMERDASAESPQVQRSAVLPNEPAEEHYLVDDVDETDSGMPEENENGNASLGHHSEALTMMEEGEPDAYELQAENDEISGRILQDDDKPNDPLDDGNILGESDHGHPELDENQSNDVDYEDAEIDSKLQEKDAELNLQTHPSMELNQKPNVDDVHEMASSVQVGDASNKKHILHTAPLSHGSSNTETETEEEWEI